MIANLVIINTIVNHDCDDWDAAIAPLLVVAAERTLTTSLHTNATTVELGITLADDDALRNLNREHRGQDKVTNVLSFPLCDGGMEPDAPGAPLLLGDIVLGHGIITREAKAQGKSLPDHATHLIVHGVLHLLGHDHSTEAEAEDMESLEISILARLGITDPYADPHLIPPPVPTPE
ncbi:MAG: rRNA maturation RNase YbeY [Rhodospirillaceae bacterium]